MQKETVKFKAVIFDLDGTLLDTLDDLADSMNRALRRLGMPQRRTEEYRYLIGGGIADMATRSLPENHRDDETIRRCIGFMLEDYREHWADRTRPYDGIPGMLDSLAASGVKMAILSNKPDHFTKLCASRLLANWRFEAVQGSSDSLPKKPDPGGALNIARQLGVAPREFLYAGDSGTDMKTAVAAGMCPVGVLWGFRSAEELSAAGAAVLIAEPDELPNLL